MNAVVTTTIISVLGAGLFGLMIQYMRVTNTRLANLETKLDSLISIVHAMDNKFTGQIKDLDNRITSEIKDLEIRLTDKFTAQIKDLDSKFTGHLTDLRKEVYAGFKAHGERLARIEVELNIHPPQPEAA